ncbi:sensor histidine kinase [Chitinophaga solisilvae]|uniref:sensor histidine kinase n=1 Tax=Chitinophaga solisilvae TaxID=1233460 RepID=UPI0013715D9F|nr:ATP-binding protein [Chitinophaga solisilvae]
MEDNGIYLLFFTGTVTFFLLSLFIVLLVMNQKQRNLQAGIRAAATATAYREELLRSTLQAAEKERERIARDLHDEMGSLLSVSISRLKNNLPDQQVVLPVLEEAQQTIRRIAFDAFPGSLQLFGLRHALRMLISRVSAIHPAITLQYETGDAALSKEVSLSVYRILQELLTNTLKYAAAANVHISVTCSEALLELQYEDDGGGADMDKISPGSGLNNIYTRILLTKGACHISSQPGGGFRFQAHVPLIHTDHDH